MSNQDKVAAPTILIIDDDAGIRNLLKRAFEKSGYAVFTAQNGREGVETAIAKLPDLIVSDVMMPEMSGYELCQTLKQHPAAGTIPIILLTAKGDAESTVKGFEAGADEYIAKPFEMKEVLARVGRILRWVSQKQEQQPKISGSLDKMPLFDLLRFCEDHRISGVIHLTRQVHEGHKETTLTSEIHLKLGEISKIRLRDLDDLTEALDELMAWPDGAFRVAQEELLLPEEEVARKREEASDEAQPLAARLSAQLTEPLQSILAELQTESGDLDNAVITDASGALVSAIRGASAQTESATVSALVTRLADFHVQAEQELGLGPLSEGLILSEHGLMLIYLVEQLGALGVTALKENQGMLRWNCKEALEKITETLSKFPSLTE